MSKSQNFKTTLKYNLSEPNLQKKQQLEQYEKYYSVCSALYNMVIL